MFFKKKDSKKKQHQSNSPLKKDSYKGNIIEDDSNLEERTKQSIESKDQDINSEQDENLEFSDLSEEIDELNIGSPLKKFFKKLQNIVKKKKKQKFVSYINNDRAPSLDNEVISDSSLSKSEVKKRKSILASMSNIFMRNKSLRLQVREESNKLKGLSVNDISQDEAAMNKIAKIRQEHTEQLADARNDLGESSKKGRWADALSDSNIKEKKEGRGR